MTPQELLNAAADRVNELAANASREVWKAISLAPQGHRVWWVEQDGPEEFACVAELSNANAESDARWIAALSPEVIASALEAWLRQAAAEIASMWEVMAPGSVRFVLHTDNSGMHDGTMSDRVWTVQSRLDALRPRWGNALTIAEKIMASAVAAPQTGNAEAHPPTPANPKGQWS